MKKTAVGFVFMILITAVFSMMAVYAADFAMATGLPYDSIVFGSVEGNPFASASRFNLFVLGVCENPQEVEGGLAVGSSLVNQGDLSVGRGVKMSEDAKNTRLIVGSDTRVSGYLNTYGNVIAGADFSTKPNSTYELPVLGEQIFKEIDELYSSEYIPWEPTPTSSSTRLISQEESLYLSAGSVGAKLHVFFEDAKKTLTQAQDELFAMTANGVVLQNDNTYVMSAERSFNIFNMNLNGQALEGEIVFETPTSAVNIVNITGTNKITAHLLTGGDNVLFNFIGEELYCSGNIDASVLAPNSDFYALDGGSISGNLAVGNYYCEADANFELIYSPFRGSAVTFSSYLS